MTKAYVKRKRKTHSDKSIQFKKNNVYVSVQRVKVCVQVVRKFLIRRVLLLYLHQRNIRVRLSSMSTGTKYN